MIPLVILAGAAIATGVVIAIFWKEITEWMKKIWIKLPDSVKQNLQGALSFVEKIDSTIKNLMVYFSYNENTQKWTETTVSRMVELKDIPDHIRKKMVGTNKVDISEELQEKLVLAMS